MQPQQSAPVEWLQERFDEAMRNPASSRGQDIEETTRLLAEAAKLPSAPAPYADLMHAFEALYLEEFLRTCMINPTFAQRIRGAMARYR